MFWIAAVLAGSGDMQLVLIMGPGNFIAGFENTHCLKRQSSSCNVRQCFVGGDCVHPGCVQIRAPCPSGKLLYQALPIFYS